MSDRERAAPLFSRIDELYAELRGVEASWEVLTAPLKEWEGRALQDGTVLAGTLGTAVFQIRGSHPFSVSYSFPGSETPEYNEPFVGELQAAMDAAYRTAHSEASGSMDYWRYHLEQVTQPRAEPLATSAYSMEKVADWLYEFTDDDVPAFVHRLSADWPRTSRGSSSFFLFYEDLADLTNHYWVGASRLCAMMAGTANVITQYQRNLVEVLTAGRDQLEGALEAWQAHQGPAAPRGFAGGKPSQVLGGASLAFGIIGLFPPAAPVAGPASVVTGILSYVAADKEAEQTEIEDAEDGVDIISRLTVALASLRREFDTALTRLSGGGDGVPDFGAYVADVLGNPNWKPNEVALA